MASTANTVPTIRAVDPKRRMMTSFAITHLGRVLRKCTKWKITGKEHTLVSRADGSASIPMVHRSVPGRMKARKEDPKAPINPEIRPKKGTKKATVAVNRQQTSRIRFP